MKFLVFLCVSVSPCVIPLPAHAEIIDRIAVSLGNSVITNSDIDHEIRVTAFQSGNQPDFSLPNRRATAQRMIEQKLIRREMEQSHYPFPSPAEADPLLEQLRTSRYRDDAAYQQALDDYRITEQDLRDELIWQLTLLRFIEVRFRPGVRVSDQEIEDYFNKEVKPVAEATHPGQPLALEDYRNQIENTLAEQRTDREVDNWLEDARKRAQIVFHPEAFE
ncbi:MAG: hypothetical protein JO336_21970 [Acidobacteriia bacterium]|nr:hypothetical protein [Terriglobia bacterium]